MAKKKAINETEFILEAKEEFKAAETATEALYREMTEDLEFVKGGNHWPEDVRAQREGDGRPCLEINKMPMFVDRVLGDIRQSRPSISVKPVDDKSDPDTAEVITGLIRNIEVQSSADVAYDTACESAVRCGIGRFRITTEYADYDVFDQDIRIKRMKNPFSVYWGPSEEFDRSDAKYCFVTEKIPRKTFKERWPKAGMIEFDAARDKDDGWATKDHIRVAEYFKVDTEKKTIYQVLVQGEMEPKVVDALPEAPHEVLNEREVDARKLTWTRINGREILEGPIDLPGKYIPIIDVLGKEICIENQTVYHGIVRHAKDPMRLYNYFRSMDAETVALAPRAPWIVTPAMVAKNVKMWNESHKKNYPYLLYEPDPKLPGGKPERQFPVLSNRGISEQVMISDQELHDTTQLQLASLGKKSNEKSGVAIKERAKEGDIGSFTYIDNLVRAMRYAGRVIIDLIPKIYDTERVERIINEDGTQRPVKLNGPFEEKGKTRIYDLTAGKYDLVVTAGPSYQTQRQEALDGMIAFIDKFKEAGPIIGDLIAKNADWPGADKIADRLKKMLPEGIAEEDDETQQGQQGQQGQQQGGINEQQAMAQAAAQAQVEIEIEKAEVELAIQKAKLEQERVKVEQEKMELTLKNIQAQQPQVKAAK